jgi:hypothetical protein
MMRRGLNLRLASVPIISRLPIVMIVAMAGAMWPCTAPAAISDPAWEVSSVAHPTNFTAEDNAKCMSSSYPICDQYVVTVTNVGSGPVNPGGGPTTDPVTIVDTTPPGLSVIEMRAEDVGEAPGYREKGFGWECSRITAICKYSGEVPPGATLAILVEVEVTSPSGTVTNAVSVSGGGAPPASTSVPLTLPNTVEGPLAGFGIASLGFAAHDGSGRLDTQAGDHPYALTSTVDLNTSIETGREGEHNFQPAEPAKDVVLYLPLGFLGDPTGAARCTELQLVAQGSEVRTECPPASRVGTAVLFAESSVLSTLEPANLSVVSAIYNMVPDAGYPAQFGFKVFNHAAPLYTSVVHTPSGYALRVAAPGVPRAINFEGASLTFFGDPNTADENPSGAKAFFTNPSNCQAGPLTTKVEADAWSAPGHWTSAETVAYPKIDGCELLQFAPTVELHPEVSEAEAPTGLQVKIKVPQNPSRFPVLAVPQLKDVTMTLPAGMTISPGGGDGLVGCPATGPNGIDIPTGGGTPTEPGEGEAIGPDGMTHLTPGRCPQASQIGTVEITTPVLESPLEGHVYVAQPQCGGSGQPGCTSADASNGRLFGLYLEAEGSGAVIKLAGSVSANPVTGQLTAKFTENPQLPVSEVTLNLKGGGRAPLANPRQCGEALASADLKPWSAPITPDALVPAAFEVTWDGTGPCPGTLPFTPSLSAGVTNAAAGHFSTFTLTITRGDRQQDLSRLQVKLPPGLLGMLSKVPLCGEPQASLGTCGEESLLGTTLVRAGSGPQPLGVTGKVYLTGPYNGAPFGLSIVVPAVAGPFNLGDVVVRSRIDIDPNTSAVTVTSDPLPQFKDGVPLHLQMVNVSVNRPEFFFNPTNCAIKQIATTVQSTQGASVNLTAPVAAEGCNGLPFKPTFKVAAGGAVSKALGASLDVKVTSGPGQANIAGAAVTLPKQLPARLTTLQHACPAEVFAVNPATCDPNSLVGVVKATTPVLPVTLTGPAYLVSHGGAAFPDLVVVLQGEGVRINLTGNTRIVKSITSSTFASVPDAPITSFELMLPRGKHSALTSTVKSLCGQKLVMPTTLTGQNGAVIKQRTKISLTGCPKAGKAKPKAGKKAKARKSKAPGARRS